MSKNSKLLIFTHFLSTQTEDKNTHTHTHTDRESNTLVQSSNTFQRRTS